MPSVYWTIREKVRLNPIVGRSIYLAQSGMKVLSGNEFTKKVKDAEKSRGQGEGVARDLARGVDWYERAAERGHKLAQYNLAVMLSKGQGCAADPAGAIAWFEKAAAQDFREAKLALVQIFRTGRGTSVDEAAAQRWQAETERESDATSA